VQLATYYGILIFCVTVDVTTLVKISIKSESVTCIFSFLNVCHFAYKFCLLFLYDICDDDNNKMSRFAHHLSSF
jgi:hypothetical protein